MQNFHKEEKTPQYLFFQIYFINNQTVITQVRILPFITWGSSLGSVLIR